MRKKGKLIGVAAAFSLLFAASCSLTNLNAVWKDPQYQGGRLKNVLVIAETKNQVVRRIFEDDFTAKLKSRGTSAIPSYTIFPSEKTLDKDTIESKTRDLGVDAILVVRVVSTKTKQELTPLAPSYYRDFYFYDWPNRYSRFYSSPFPGGYYNDRLYYSEYEVVDLETPIYETQTGKLIWSALSETVLGGSTEVEISSAVDKIMKNLSENQLIK
jgi:hypothetical protein